MKLVVFTTILVLVHSKPNGLYHEEYNYKSSSSSYRNNELQHQKDDEGYYSKHGDLEGRIQPKVNAREQHSEYVNPRLKSLGYTSGSGSSSSGSSYGQMQAGQHYENVFQNGMFNQYQPFPHSGNYPDYGVQSNLRQISTQVQQQLAQQLHEAIMNRYRQTTAYSGGLTQAQIDADRRLLEEELRRNVSLHLQDAIQMRYGMQGVRGGLSYSLNNGHLGSTANYNNQELADLTHQLENDLIRQLNEGVRSYYHTSSSSHRVTSVKQQHHSNNDYNYQYPGNLQIPRQPLHPIQPQPLQPLPLPTRVDYGPVVPNPDSLTTIATRVQHDLNEHLNKILEDTKHRYFSSHAIHHIHNYDHILQQLKEDLRHNVTHQFELQLQHHQQRFNIDDLENYKRQIENHLITRLIRDFNQQRDNYLSTQPTPNGYEIHSNYYPNRINQEEWANLQRQLRDDMSRQLQLALMQQQHHHQQQQRQYQHYGGNTMDNFNYNALLQQLTDELNRNLTQQIEYRLRQHYGSSFSRGQQYDTQMAQLRNVLENDLQQQLRHGLQQYSQHYSWSSSSSSSSASSSAAASQTGIKNYRPVRGYETFSIPLNNPDCMMGDDPSAYQQLEDLTDDVDDLTQQLVDDNDDQKLQKSQKLEDLDDQQQQQQQEIFPQSTGFSHHHQHFSNHLTSSSSVPRVRFVKKYYITDSDGSRKQVDEAQFLKNLEISQHISSDSRGNLKFFIGDNFGHNVEIKAGQQLITIEQVFHKWLQELLNLQTHQSINQKFYIEDQNGERKLLTFDEFQEYLKKFRTGNLHMTYKFYQTDNNGVRTEINPYTVNLIGHSFNSKKYYVIDSDGKRREINATEYQRLSQKPQTFITRTVNQRFYRIDSQGRRHEITQEEYNRSKANQQQLSDDDLKSLEPGFETQSQSQIGQIEQDSFGSQSHINRQNQIVRGKLQFGQEIDDSDLTQQVQQPDFGRPQSGNLQQQTEDLDLTQQVQQPIFNRPQLHRRPSYGNLEFGSQQHNQKPQPSGKLQNQLEFGQEIDDSDLTQQVQQPHSGKLQEIDDIDLTQQVQQPDFGKPQSGNLQQRPEFGQQIDDDDDLTQQVQQPNYGGLEFGSQYRQKPKPSQLGQEIDDSDLTQQVQQPDFGRPQPSNLQRRPEFGQQQQQLQQPGFNRRPSYGGLELGSQYRHKPKPTEFGQEIDDSDLTQQVQQPHSGKLQEIDDLDLTQQVQQPDFGRPQSGNLQQQETEDLDLTQQVQQPHSGKLQHPDQVFNKPQLSRRPSYGNLEFGSQHNQKPQPSGKLQNQLEFGQEIDDSDLTQQVQQPHSGKLQEIDDIDLTQQVQQPDFGRPTSGKLQQPEFGHPIDDLDLTQQVQQPNFGKPKSGNLQQRPEFGQQIDGDDDLTQQVQQPDFGRPSYGGLELGSQYRQKPKPSEFGQEIDDSDLTQQVQQPDFGKPQSGNLQRLPEFGQQQQVQQPSFNRRPSYGNLEFNSQYRQKPKPTEFGQEIDDSDLTQQVQQPDFGRPQSGNLQQQTDDLDLTQQVQQPDFGSKPTSGKLQQFGQQTEDLDLTQQVQQPDFGRPQLYRKPSYGRFEIGSYHQQSGKLQQPQEFGQQIDESDQQQQQVQQHLNILGTAQDLAQKDLDFKRGLVEQAIGQPIEPQISTSANQHLQEFGQQIDESDLTQQVQQPSSILGTTEDLAKKDLEFKQRLIQPLGQPTNQQEAEQTSQQLIDALRQHANNNNNNYQTMAYKPRPVYGVIDIDNHQTLVPVGTTRHLSHNSQHDPLVNIDAHLKPSDSHIDVQTPLGAHGIDYNDHYDGSSYGGSISSYSSGPYYNHNSHSDLHVGGLNNQKQSDDIETPGVVTATHTRPIGLKTRVIHQNQIPETTTEEEEEVTTTTEQPGFFKRLGSKVRNKVTSIRDRIF